MGKRIAVIGAGPGGYVAAINAARLGGDITLIERENAGGTCLNWGCIPSKILKTTSDLVDRLHRASEFGIETSGDFSVDMDSLMARKDNVIKSQVRSLENLFKTKNIRYLKGKSRIKAEGLLEVEYDDGTLKELGWDSLILAPGSAPLPMPEIPFDGTRILSSDHALELRSVPSSLLVVGGGVIGCEFASIYSSLGARVTIVEAMDRILPLPSVDEACSKVIQREMKKKKISYYLEHIVQVAGPSAETVEVEVLPFKRQKAKGREPVSLRFEKILVCIGRGPATDGLGLERLGIEVDEKGWVKSDAFMETSFPGVFAIGDVLGPEKIMLAHCASAEALVASENAMGGRKKMDYSGIPGAIFTTPEIANVGLTDRQASEKGYDASSETVLFRVLGKAQAMGDIAGQAKVIWDRGTGKILGVHLIGPHATDLIGEACLAVKSGCTMEDLAATVHAHPTLCEIMTEVAQKALGRAVHG